MKLADILRPMLVRFPRPSMELLNLIGAGVAQDSKWKAVTPRYVSYYDRRLGCVVSADRGEWGGRSVYYWGRYYDVTQQTVFAHFLASGWTFIDVGANLGFHSLFASKLVGSEGRVFSFEPNPSTHAVLSSHIGINRIRNIRSFQMGLSDEEGELILSQTGEHSGEATLRKIDAPSRSSIVPIRVGDDVLREFKFDGKAFLKVDTEGNELHVLRGLQKTLERIDVVSVEVTPKWIAELGGTAEQLFSLMKDSGFMPFEAELHWLFKIFSPQLRFSPLEAPKPEQHDVLFVRPHLTPL